MTPVTDPGLLAELEGQPARKPVTDPALLAQLEAGPNVGEDVAKSAGVGVAKGTIGLAGSGGDIRELMGKAISKGAGLVGYEVSPESAARGVGSATRTMLPWLSGPTSGQLQKNIESITGEFRKPETVYGEYAQTAGEFLPAVAAGPGGVARRAVTQALVPAATSETAGQTFKGTAAEPFARVVGALAGGVGAGRIAQGRLPDRAVTPAQIEARAATGYRSPEVGTLIFRPEAVDDLSSSITAALRRGKANDRLAPTTNALVDEMRTPVNGVWHTYEDLQTMREMFQKQAANFANPQEQRAASIAVDRLTRYIDNIPQRDLVAGQAEQASATLQRARGDYASAKTAERVVEKLRNAELQASSAHSGGNIDNATRQKLRTLLTSRKQSRGLTEDELASIEGAVRGSPVGNALRAGGKALGGGGGLGALASSFVGGSTFGPLGMAAPAAGYALKRAGDALTRREADRIVAAILARAPSGASQAGMNAVARALAQRGLTPLQIGAVAGGLASLPGNRESQ
jgi:hypothetical protein